MFSDDAPLPEPGGALEPPARKPPTAVALATPQPPRPPRSVRSVLMSDPRTQRFVDNAIEAVFNAADNVADEIAGLLRLRKREEPPSRNLPTKISPE
jgi:hypothetical protein